MAKKQQVQPAILPAPVAGALHALAKLRPGLAPGDFRAVRAAFAFAVPEERTHPALLEALRHEVACKMADATRMGFGGNSTPRQ